MEPATGNKSTDAGEVNTLAESLHTYERKVLAALPQASSISQIADAAKLQEVEAMRGLQWLSNKKLVSVIENTQEVVSLDKNGEKYKKEGLPEMRFLRALGKESSVEETARNAGISVDEISICLGVLRAKGAITIKQGSGQSVSKDAGLGSKLTAMRTPQGDKLADERSPEESFLQKKFPLFLKDIQPDDTSALEQLRKRRSILKVDRKTLKQFSLTGLGNKVLRIAAVSGDVSDRVTPAMLRDGSWKQKKFRRYDVEVNVPAVSGGKFHFYARFLDKVRERFLAMGFTEMDGPLVETEFWDMDALFMPQSHSARDIHGAYYVQEPKYGDVDPKVLEKVKASHEIGKGTLSGGWRYPFSVEKTRRHILRTQGTALSARAMSLPGLSIPGKYFSIARCFRPDVVDATHAPDFNQVEGFVIEEGLTFQHLKGLLRLFAEEFAGASQIRIKPGYFPFTEPSAELFAKHPQLGWIELGGSGIFRPEVVKPLVGREISVLAWGIGIDRIAMFNFGIKDLRELFSSNLAVLRAMKVS